MASEVKLEGLAELQHALMNLPELLKAEAAGIVQQAANDCEREITAAYGNHRVTGNLVRGVTKTTEPSRFGIAARVKSNAKHVHIFEDGTDVRHTRSGANRGRMPKAGDHERLVPIAIRNRRIMVKRLAEMVQRQGLVVSQT